MISTTKSPFHDAAEELIPGIFCDSMTSFEACVNQLVSKLNLSLDGSRLRKVSDWSQKKYLPRYYSNDLFQLIIESISIRSVSHLIEVLKFVKQHSSPENNREIFFVHQIFKNLFMKARKDLYGKDIILSFSDIEFLFGVSRYYADIHEGD